MIEGAGGRVGPRRDKGVLGTALDEAAHAVVQEAKDAGVFIFAGGLDEDVAPVLVAGDGTVTAGTYPETKELNGGFTVVDVPTREAALD